MKSIFFDESFDLELGQIVSLLPENLDNIQFQVLTQGPQAFTVEKLVSHLNNTGQQAASSALTAVNTRILEAISRVSTQLGARGLSTQNLEVIRQNLGPLLAGVVAIKNMPKIHPLTDEKGKKVYRAQLKKVHAFIKIVSLLIKQLDELMIVLARTIPAHSSEMEAFKNLRHQLRLSASQITVMERQDEVALNHNASAIVGSMFGGVGATEIDQPNKQQRSDLDSLVHSCLLYTSPSPRDRG